MRTAEPHDIVEIVPDNLPSDRLWTPTIGNEVHSLLEHLSVPEHSKESLRSEALSILSRCLPPLEVEGRRTGLIIGYIQSGKTMSFTTVAALARDNGYRLVILLSGMKVNLFTQSADRIEKDLRLAERMDRKWQFFKNPRNRPEVRQRIEAAFRSRDDVPGTGRKTVLITVMKNRTHLDNLSALLASLDMEGVSALIIDDEADQASLHNLARTGNESATYSRIVRLRQLVRHHTFLQYTATPQALLLINLIDMLSPEFAELLTPGTNYTGGRIFFERDFSLIRRIPPDEIGTRDEPLMEVPDSLLEAMRLFYVGVAVGLLQGGLGNRTMMVHPSRETMPHSNYSQWVRETRRNWERILSQPVDDLDRQELVRDFEAAYQDLARTVDDLPSFDDVIGALAPAVQETIIIEVNAAGGRSSQPDFRQVYAHIIVGGEMLNRGYTLEGLTVTYMPRGCGMGNADTIQQRARWFGYKAGYLGFCRVYLEDEILDAYRQYVEHEDNVRSLLSDHRATGRPLREWRRAFILSSRMRPTRDNVIAQEYVRGGFSDNWFDPHTPHDSPEAVADNRRLVQDFVSRLAFHPDEGHSDRTDSQRHLVASEVSLRMVHEELLTKLHFTRPSDTTRFNGLLLQVQRYLEREPDATCSVYQMSSGSTRERGLSEQGAILNLFQGPHPDTAGAIYPGDRRIGNGPTLSIQLHTLLLRQNGVTVAENVLAVAVWVPRVMAADWLVQEQE